MENNGKPHENRPCNMNEGKVAPFSQLSADVLIRVCENMVQNCAVAIFVIDSRHHVIHWNRACEELTGIRAADILGTADHWKAFYDQERPTLSDLIIDNSLDRMGDLYTVFGPSLLISHGLHAEGWYPNVGGKKRYLIFDASPIYHQDGLLLGVVETLQDITVLKLVEEEKERRPEPTGIEEPGVPEQRFKKERRFTAIERRRGDGQQKVAQQRQRDADRADQQIFPRRFERPMMAMKIDHWRAGKRRGLDGDPQQAEMPAGGYKRHRGQEQQEASRENSLGRVHEEKSFFHIHLPAGLFLS